MSTEEIIRQAQIIMDYENSTETTLKFDDLESLVKLACGRIRRQGYHVCLTRDCINRFTPYVELDCPEYDVRIDVINRTVDEIGEIRITNHGLLVLQQFIKRKLVSVNNKNGSALRRTVNGAFRAFTVLLDLQAELKHVRNAARTIEK